MARHLRVEYPGAIYHVTSRMIGYHRSHRSHLFLDDKDRQRFVDSLGERVEQYHIRLYLLVCMTNHFHLCFETPEGNCSKFMQSLSTAYTVYYNLRHRRHGHLLDGRYKAKLVEGDDYLLALTRYVHLNPVRVGPIRDLPIEEKIKYLRSYRWSTYQSYTGRRKPFDFVEYGPALSQMSGKRREWPRRYREFVESGLAEDDEDFRAALKESPRSIGSDGFRAWVDGLYQDLAENRDVSEDISFRRITEPLTPESVIEVLAEVLNVDEGEFRHRTRNSPLRGIAARSLIRYAGQNQREVAEFLQAGTGSAISKQLKRLSETLPADKKLCRLIGKAEKRLAARRTALRENGLNS